MNELEQAGRLNAFLRAEVAAVLAYQHALRSLDGRLGGEMEHLRDFAAAHQRTVAALQVCVRTLGGVADAEVGVWGSFALLRDAVSFRQLLEAEQRGLTEYVAALPFFEGDVSDLVEHELIPRQRRHVAAISKILGDIVVM